MVQWCQWAFGNAVHECATSLGERVFLRQSEERDVRYPQISQSELKKFVRLQLLARTGTEPPLFESATFVATAPSSLTSPTCNRLNDLPRRGKTQHGALGPSLWRPAGMDGALHFGHSASGDAPPPEGGFVILLRLHERAVLGTENAGSVDSLRDPSFACLEGLRQSLLSLSPEQASSTRIDMFLNGFSSAEKKAAFASFVKWFLVSADDAGVAGSLHKTNGALYSVNVYTDVPAGNAAPFEHLLAHIRAHDLDPSAIVLQGSSAHLVGS